MHYFVGYIISSNNLNKSGYVISSNAYYKKMDMLYPIIYAIKMDALYPSIYELVLIILNGYHSDRRQTAGACMQST